MDAFDDHHDLAERLGALTHEQYNRMCEAMKADPRFLSADFNGRLKLMKKWLDYQGAKL